MGDDEVHIDDDNISAERVKIMLILQSHDIIKPL
jgi:hypothetical protein